MVTRPHVLLLKKIILPNLKLNIYSLLLLTLTLPPSPPILFLFLSSNGVGPEDKEDKFVIKSSVKWIATSMTERER